MPDSRCSQCPPPATRTLLGENAVEGAECVLCRVQTCILAGCDFVKGLPGIGMKKAHTHMKRLRSFLKACPLL